MTHEELEKEVVRLTAMIVSLQKAIVVHQRLHEIQEGMNADITESLKTIRLIITNDWKGVNTKYNG